MSITSSCALATILGAATCWSQAGTLTVCPSDETYNSIQDAIDAAVDGDTIEVCGGVYYENLDTMGKSISIIGEVDEAGNPLTVLDGEQSQQSILTSNNSNSTSVLFENLIVQNGFEYSGGAGMNLIGGSATIRNCVIQDCVAFSYGGALQIDGTDAHIEDSIFRTNRAVADGGAINSYGGNLYIQDSLFDGNYSDGAFGRGGAISFSGILELDGSTFENNHAFVGGGAISAIVSAELTANDCLFTNNRIENSTTTNVSGSAVEFNFLSNGTFTNSTITGNQVLVPGSGETGAALAINSNLVTAVNTIICDNYPQQVDGVLQDGGGNCIADSCDECYSQVTVCSSGADFTSIQEAIDFIQPESGVVTEIQVCDETFQEFLDFQGKSIALVGATDVNGAPLTIIDGDGAGRVLTITGGSESGSSVHNIIIQNGSAVEGGGILVADGAVSTVENCLVRYCSALEGSAILVQDGGLELIGSYIGCNDANGSEGSAAVQISSDRPDLEVVLMNTRIANNTPTQINGDFVDAGGNTISNCIGDITGSGSVDGSDLNALLGSWGPCDDPLNCPADLTCDGVVDGADLNILLANWGSCTK